MMRIFLLLMSLWGTLYAMAYDFYAIDADGNVIYYSIIDENSVEVSRNPKIAYSGDLKIPSEVTDASSEKTYTVTGIGDNAFRDAEITSINWPSTITTSKIGAFLDCKKLSKVFISDLDQWASTRFMDCGGSPLLYGAVLMYKNAPLNSLDDLTEKCTRIGAYAFQNCELLKEIQLPASIENIGEEAFANCSAITKFIIPGKTSFLGEGVFKNCKSLTTLIIEDADSEINLGRYGYNVIGGNFKDCPLNTLYLGRSYSYETGGSYSDSMEPFYKKSFYHLIINAPDIIYSKYKGDNIYVGPRAAFSKHPLYMTGTNIFFIYFKFF